MKNKEKLGILVICVIAIIGLVYVSLIPSSVPLVNVTNNSDADSSVDSQSGSGSQSTGTVQAKKCSYCEGVGKVNCIDCGGKGIEICPDCLGNGCIQCGGDGNLGPCTNCGGSGKVVCPYCNGDGIINPGETDPDKGIK